MAAGVIIGRVAVKVIPDTENFKQDLERDLDRIERSLDPIEIDIKVDSDTVVKEAKRAREKAEKEMKDLRLKINLDSEDSLNRSMNSVKSALDKLKSETFSIPLDEDSLNDALRGMEEALQVIKKVKVEVDEADPASVRKAVDSINNELDKIRRVELEIDLDEESLTKQRDRLRDQMDKTYREIRERVQNQMKDIQIGMDVDPISAARTLRKIEVLLEQIEDAKMTITPEMDERARFTVMRKIQDMKDQVADMQATIHPDLDAPAVAGVAARLRELARDRGVEFIPRLNQGAAGLVSSALARMAGARILGGYIQDVVRGIREFDKVVPKVIVLSTAVAGLSASFLASSSNIFALGASLATIAPAGLALPGLLAGIGIGVGVMIAALKDFNKVFPDVKEAFADMQDSISTEFFKEAAKPMREMLDNVLPALAKGFDKTASRIGLFFANLSGATDRILTPELGGMFDNLAKSIQIAARAADPLVNIITTLGKVGASYLPRLATFFEDITRKFSNFIVLNERTGDLYDWIDQGIVALKDFARVGGNVALIISDIAKAATAAGGSSLGELADGLGRIRAITSSAGFQEGLVGVFEAAHTAMRNISQIAGPAVYNLFKEIGSLLQDILPKMGTTIGVVVSGIASALTQPEVLSGVRAMFDGIADGVLKLTPAFAPLGRALGSIGPLVGDLARTLGSVLGAAIPPVADGLTKIGDALAPLVPIMGEALLTAVEALAPVFTNLSDAIASMLEGGGTAIIGGMFTTIADALKAIPEPILTLLVAGLAGMVISYQLLAISVPIVNGAMAIYAAVTGTAAGSTTALGIALAILTSPITLIVGAILILIAMGVTLYKHWDELTVLAKAAWYTIRNHVVAAIEATKIAIKTKWEEIKTNTKASWEAIKTAVTVAIDGMRTAVQARFDAIKTAITTKWNEIKTDTNARWNEIKNTVTTKLGEIAISVATKLTEMRTTVTTKWNEIKTTFTTALGSIATSTASGIATVKTNFQTGVNTLKVLATTAWEQTKAVFTTGIATVRTVVSTLPSVISGALGNLGGILTGAGRQVIDGFVNGIQAGFSRVRSTLGSLTSMLPSWKGPPSTDKVILVSAGEMVIQGLIDGMESQYSAVKRSLKGLTDDLGNTFIESPAMADIAQPDIQARKGLVGSVRTAVAESSDIGNGKTLIYHAAPGSSLGSEEDLFAAADRGRMVGW